METHSHISCEVRCLYRWRLPSCPMTQCKMARSNNSNRYMPTNPWKIYQKISVPQIPQISICQDKPCQSDYLFCFLFVTLTSTFSYSHVLLVACYVACTAFFPTTLAQFIRSNNLLANLGKELLHTETLQLARKCCLWHRRTPFFGNRYYHGLNFIVFKVGTVWPVVSSLKRTTLFQW